MGLFSTKAKPTEHFEVEHTDEEWRQRLTPEQYHVLRGHGTERAGTSPLDQEKRAGTFVCAACGQPLFPSDDEVRFRHRLAELLRSRSTARSATSDDSSLCMTRTEVHCARCGGHLGHVFDDGPQPTGLRYCMNGVAMGFEPKSGDKAG